MQTRVSLLLLILLVSSTVQALADVDLVTVPRREGTQLTICDSEDTAMVREHRQLTVKPKINRIQYCTCFTKGPKP